MAETLVENQVCEACGADIRPNALFCYHCGAQVAEEDESAGNPKQTAKLKSEKVFEDEGSESENESELKRLPEEKKNSAREIKIKSVNNGAERVKLKSAAALRNKARKLEPKKVEIIWEEHENAPNAWFIGAAILLVIFAIVIYFIAMSLK